MEKLECRETWPGFPASLEPIDESWHLHQLFAFAISSHDLHVADSVWTVIGLVHRQRDGF